MSFAGSGYWTVVVDGGYVWLMTMDTVWGKNAHPAVTDDAGGGCGRRGHLAVTVEPDVVVVGEDHSFGRVVAI
ncbi:hypothetical protein RB195_017407 [Necator americanus]|uniref:Uncharacterized protein n=1 Tax=Necator americanus TaxID=51031 RepID=A0ABR1C707_NECAM